MPLRDIPAKKFPFRVEEYNRLDDRIATAAARFFALGYPDLGGELDAVRARLSAAWEAITTAEREGR
jgi:hypothetical protein